MISGHRYFCDIENSIKTNLPFKADETAERQLRGQIF